MEGHRFRHRQGRVQGHSVAKDNTSLSLLDRQLPLWIDVSQLLVSLSSISFV